MALILRFLRNKTLSNTIRKISACFCFCGGINENVDFLNFNRVDCTHCTQRFLEVGVCRLPLISTHILEVLPSVTIRTLHPLLKEQGFSRPINEAFIQHPFVIAATQGNLEMVKKLFRKITENSCFFEPEIIASACTCAAAHGHREVLHFLFTKVASGCSCFLEAEVLKSCCFFAAANGHHNIIKFLIFEVFPESSCFVDREILNTCCICAAANGHVKVLKFLLARAFPENLFFVDDEILNSCCVCAAANGRIEILKFLFKKGSWDSHWFPNRETLHHCCIFAADNGHFETIDFFFDEDLDISFFNCNSEREIRKRCFSNQTCNRGKDFSDFLTE